MILNEKNSNIPIVACFAIVSFHAYFFLAKLLNAQSTKHTITKIAKNIIIQVKEYPAFLIKFPSILTNL